MENLSVINFADYERVWSEPHEFSPLYRQICYKYYKEEVVCDVMRSRLTTKEVTLRYLNQFIEGLFNPKQFYRFKWFHFYCFYHFLLINRCLTWFINIFSLKYVNFFNLRKENDNYKQGIWILIQNLSTHIIINMNILVKSFYSPFRVNLAKRNFFKFHYGFSDQKSFQK